MTRRHAFILSSIIYAAAFGTACLPEDSTENYPTPEMLKPVPLAPRPPPVLTPEEKLAARQREFRALFSGEMLEALDTMEWGQLPEGEQAAFNYNLQNAYSCPVSYVSNMRLKEENDLAGIVSTVLRENFQLEFKKGGRTDVSAILTPESFVGFQAVPGGVIYTFSLPKPLLRPQNLDPKAPGSLFDKKYAPIFWNNIIGSIEYARNPYFSVKKYPSPIVTSLFNFFPPIPEAIPGAETEWHYAPLYDTSKMSDVRPAGRVKFVTWFKLLGRNAALLNVSWPEDEQDWIASNDLLVFKIDKRKLSQTFLKQTKSPRAEFVVSESGEILLARLQGTAKGRAEFVMRSQLNRTTINRRTGQIRSHSQPQEITYEEQIYYTYFLRALKDCSGSLIKIPDPEVLQPEDLKSITQEFFSLYLIGRKSEALALLSPEIHAHASDDFLKYFFDTHLSETGTDIVGTPISHVDIQPDNPSMKKMGTGYLWEGIHKGKKKNTYSLTRGVLLGGKPYLTFIGISSKPARTDWDIIQLSANEKIALRRDLDKFPHSKRPSFNPEGSTETLPKNIAIPTSYGPKVKNVRRR